MRAQTEKTTFSFKDDWGKSLHVCWSGGQGTCKKSRPHTARAYTTLVVLVKVSMESSQTPETQVLFKTQV